MVSSLSIVSLILELLSWLGISLGVLALIAGYARRAASQRWLRTEAIIASPTAAEQDPDTEDQGFAFRWLAPDGRIYSAAADTHETEHLDVGTDVSIRVHPRHFDLARTDDLSHDGRALRIAGWILMVVGIASVIVQLLLELMNG